MYLEIFSRKHISYKLSHTDGKCIIKLIKGFLYKYRHTYSSTALHGI